MSKLSSKNLFTILLTAYIIVRVLSFLSYYQPAINAIFAISFIIGFVYICIKNLSFAWALFVIELLLDGVGHFFEFQSFILRTWFMGIFAVIWLYKKIKQKDFHISLPRPLLILMVLYTIAIFWAVLQGFLQGNHTMYILQDAVLYFFLFLFFPTQEKNNLLQTHFFTILKVFIIGSAIFSLVSFVIYSSGFGHLPDWYYHWIRNVSGGKITDLGSHFFRIVSAEHLFIVPILLVLSAQCIYKQQTTLWWLLFFASSFIFITNFTRIYFLAYIIGLCVLAYRYSFKRWFISSLFIGISIMLIFFSTHFIASRGQDIGLSLLGLKVAQSTQAEPDMSSAVRMALLPNIFSTIRTHPIRGSGLGTEVQYNDPISNKIVSRTQFDWGYFEMIAELGLIGFMICILFLLNIAYYLFLCAYKANLNVKKIPLLRGLFAGFISLFIINITTPALFQGFGVLYVVLLLFVIINQKDLIKIPFLKKDREV